VDEQRNQRTEEEEDADRRGRPRWRCDNCGVSCRLRLRTQLCTSSVQQLYGVCNGDVQELKTLSARHVIREWAASKLSG